MSVLVVELAFFIVSGLRTNRARGLNAVRHDSFAHIRTPALRSGVQRESKECQSVSERPFRSTVTGGLVLDRDLKGTLSVLVQDNTFYRRRRSYALLDEDDHSQLQQFLFDSRTGASRGANGSWDARLPVRSHCAFAVRRTQAS